MYKTRTEKHWIIDSRFQRTLSFNMFELILPWVVLLSSHCAICLCEASHNDHSYNSIHGVVYMNLIPVVQLPSLCGAQRHHDLLLMAKVVGNSEKKARHCGN